MPFSLLRVVYVAILVVEGQLQVLEIIEVTTITISATHREVLILSIPLLPPKCCDLNMSVRPLNVFGCGHATL